MDTIKHAMLRQTALLLLIILQLASTLEKQVFDILGQLWAPVIGNFLQIIAAVLGICGVCRFNRSLIITYAAGDLLWLAWNIFVMCLYLEFGTLNRNTEGHILTLGTDGSSWWQQHGADCHMTNSSSPLTNSSSPLTNSSRVDAVLVSQDNSSPSEGPVVGCRMSYYYVEVIHAAIQCFFALAGLVASWACICFIKKDYRDLTIPSCNTQNPKSFTFPLQFLYNKKFCGKLPHKRASAQHSTGTGNLDFQLPSLPHIAFPHSPEYPVTPRYHQKFRAIDPMLSNNLKTAATLKTPSWQIQALKNSFSNLFMLNHYMCSTFFSYPASKRARLGALSHCSDETISQEDQTECMPFSIYINENNLENAALCSSRVDATNDEVELDDDIWILQTEL